MLSVSDSCYTKHLMSFKENNKNSICVEAILKEDILITGSICLRSFASKSINAAGKFFVTGGQLKLFTKCFDGSFEGNVYCSARFCCYNAIQPYPVFNYWFGCYKIQLFIMYPYGSNVLNVSFFVVGIYQVYCICI